jgi:hypothetical protein
MASVVRQAEETRIRRILEINSYDLATLELYLEQQGLVPDSTDEQAARDAVFEFRGTPSHISVFGIPVHSFFSASRAVNGSETKREFESAKYEAVRDLISMLAACKAQALVPHQGQENHGADTTVKPEEA